MPAMCRVRSHCVQLQIAVPVAVVAAVAAVAAVVVVVAAAVVVVHRPAATDQTGQGSSRGFRTGFGLQLF